MNESQLKVCNKTYKVVMLGESTVGKTSIVNVASTGFFSENQQPTVGSSFQVNRIEVNGTIMTINLWDTAGQEKYRSITPIFYREADFIILVYSINDLISFESIPKWYENIKNECLRMPKIFLCGNKTDLENERVVSTEEAMELAKKLNFDFMELSAKETPEKVEYMLKRIAIDAFNAYKAENTYSQTLKEVNVEKSCFC